MTPELDTCFPGDNRESMRRMIADGYAGRIQCIVTSPPYWGLRDYGHAGQLGLEPTLAEFIANQVEVFELCRQLLADDGTLWLNMGDSYASRGGLSPQMGQLFKGRSRQRDTICLSNRVAGVDGLKSKDLVGQPWRLAFALQDAGWYLRQDIIWHKPNPMPESVRDRCTKAHEYLFLLAKSERYYFDQAAIKEPCSESTPPRTSGNGIKMPDGWATHPGDHGSFHRDGREKGRRHLPGNKSHKGTAAFEAGDERHRTKAGLLQYSRKLAEAGNDFDAALSAMPTHRNRRSVWTVASEPFSGAHFATFPRALVEPCILAGSKPGDIVFDPYLGSGTTAEVALSLGRHWLGCEINPEYMRLQQSRTRQRGLCLTFPAGGSAEVLA